MAKTTPKVAFERWLRQELDMPHEEVLAERYKGSYADPSWNLAWRAWRAGVAAYKHRVSSIDGAVVSRLDKEDVGPVRWSQPMMDHVGMCKVCGNYWSVCRGQCERQQSNGT